MGGRISILFPLMAFLGAGSPCGTAPEQVHGLDDQLNQAERSRKAAQDNDQKLDYLLARTDWA